MSSEPIKIRDHREPTHFWADNEVYDVHAPHIGVYAFAVYMALARYANKTTAQSWPSINTIAEHLGISKPTVKRAIKTLEEHGLIYVQRPTADELAKRQTNIYTLLEVPKVPRQSQNLGNDRPSPQVITDTSLVSDVAPNTYKRTQNKEHGEAATQPAPAAATPQRKKVTGYRQPVEQASDTDNRQSRPASTKKQLPADFGLTDDLRAWGTANTPGVDLELETAALIDWARSSKERKDDWIATWRNWMRREYKKVLEQQQRRSRYQQPAQQRPAKSKEQERIELYAARNGITVDEARANLARQAVTA